MHIFHAKINPAILTSSSPRKWSLSGSLILALVFFSSCDEAGKIVFRQSLSGTFVQGKTSYLARAKTKSGKFVEKIFDIDVQKSANSQDTTAEISGFESFEISTFDAGERTMQGMFNGPNAKVFFPLPPEIDPLTVLGKVAFIGDTKIQYIRVSSDGKSALTAVQYVWFAPDKQIYDIVRIMALRPDGTKMADSYRLCIDMEKLEARPSQVPTVDITARMQWKVTESIFADGKYADCRI